MPWRLRTATSTEELSRYIPSPIPCELQHSGALGIVRKSIRCRIKAVIDNGALTWQIFADGSLRGQIDGQYIRALEDQYAILVWLETITFYLDIPSEDGGAFSALVPRRPRCTLVLQFDLRSLQAKTER